MKVILAIVLPLIIVISGMLLVGRNSNTTEQDRTKSPPPPAALRTTTITDQPTASIPTNNAQVEADSDFPASGKPQTTNANANATEFTIGTSLQSYQPFSDDEYALLRNKLGSDPEFLSSALSEFRSTADPHHARQLSALLAEIEDPRVYDVAAELAYSGDPASQLIGLELLNRIQKHNSDARNVAIQLLNTESRTDILVATLNVIATPAPNASQEQQRLISDNLFLLSTHTEPKVRAHSLSVLSQWDKQNPEVTAALSNALKDANAQVRSTAIYALTGTENIDDSLIESLLLILQNSEEKRGTREAAMLLLQQESLAGADLRRFTEAQRSLRTRQLVN